MFKTLIVVDGEEEALQLMGGELEVISFDKYLRDYPKRDELKTRIINLCDITDYLSKGYYCSLLAEARSHVVLPSVKTINQLRNLTEESEKLNEFRITFSNVKQVSFPKELLVYFSFSQQADLQKVVGKIFSQYSSPLLKLTFNESGLATIERFSFSALNEQQKEIFIQRLEEYTRTVWRIGEKRKRLRWDMAILVDPTDKVPPSDKDAISRFIKAAAKHGIHAEVLSIDQITNIASFDALFIRETTAIDHHTYRLACKAEDNDLVVMDDPQSILRCCNKVFLHDAFSYQNVPSLKTHVISNANQETLEDIEYHFSYPIVLKMPEGSFSKGVYKVNDRKELKERLESLFQDTALVLAQEYMYTEYDWRIGVLNGRAIYACKYLMARNHWQIYNHEAKKAFSGGFETLPTFEVPKPVLDAALKACKIIGNGLYGVDIKEHEGKAYVIEVNDNPSIDHEVEDAYLGNELYMQIMGEFQRRLESRGR